MGEPTHEFTDTAIAVLAIAVDKTGRPSFRVSLRCAAELDIDENDELRRSLNAFDRIATNVEGQFAAGQLAEADAT